MTHSLDDALVRNAIWREDHYDPKLCDHGGDGGPTCAYCEPHDDDTPDDWPADKERAERQARAALEAAGVAELREALTEIEHAESVEIARRVASAALNPRQNEEEGE